MPLEVMPITRPEWTPLPYDGIHNVEAKGLIKLEHLSLAMLRFQPGGTIHEHPAPFEIDVICLEGRGMTSVGDEQAAIHAGQWVRWPANRPHRLWTEDNGMTTLMVEHLSSQKA